MILCAEQRNENNEPCRPKESHLIFCAQWFKNGDNLSVRRDILTLKIYIERLPSATSALDACIFLQWGIALVSVYCAFVLAFRQPAAITVAKRGLIVVTVAELAVAVAILLVVRPPLEVFSVRVVMMLVKPVVFFSIWFAYLRRSKRVKETYDD